MLNLLSTKFNWLIGHKSQINLKNKRLIYTAIFKPAWSYGAEIWGTAAESNIRILETFQHKFLRKIAKAPWYVTNSQIREDLNIEAVHSYIRRKAERYFDRLHRHPNPEAVMLLGDSNNTRRLRRQHIHDLIN